MVQDFKDHYGGVVANFCVGVARNGVKSGFMGSAGDDPDGHEIMENFENNNMNTDHFFLKKDTKSPRNIIVVGSHGDRQILQDPYMQENILEPNEIIEDYVAEADVFHADAVSIETARKCMEIAEEAGTKVSFDLERHVAVYGLDEIGDLIEKTDFLLPNQGELRSLPGKMILRRQLKNVGPWAGGSSHINGHQRKHACDF